MKKPTSEQFYKILQAILGWFNQLLLAVIKAYLNTQFGQGSLKKFINWLADNMYDETVKPILETLLVHVGYMYDVKEGKVLIERLKKAEEAHNEADYNSTVDDILN
jgi:hypothetical protein